MLGIFSRAPIGALHKSWVRIEDHHPAFRQIGLKRTSLIKAEKLAVVHESIFQRKLGKLPADLMAQVQDALKRALFLS